MSCGIVLQLTLPGVVQYTSLIKLCPVARLMAPTFSGHVFGSSGPTGELKHLGRGGPRCRLVPALAQ